MIEDRLRRTGDRDDRWATSLMEFTEVAGSECTVAELWADAARRACVDLGGDAAVAVSLTAADRMRIAATWQWPTETSDGIVPIAPDSHTAYVLEQGEPVRFDLLDEHRFSTHPLVLQAGFRSGLSARVGSRAVPLGLVGVQYVGNVPHDHAAVTHLSSLVRILGLGLRFRHLNESASAQIDHDVLTGLVNRRGLFDALERIAAKPGGGFVILLDLDGFKAVNDAHGHAAGDEVLRVVGARLLASMRPTDLVARLNGDEFVIAGNDSDLGAAASIAERLIGHVEQTIAIPHGTAMISASAGVAAIDDRGGPVAAMAAADAAMVAAKAAGRGQVRISDRRAVEDGPIALSGLLAPGAPVDLVDVDHAIESVRVVYQPIVEAASGRVVGVEALTRGPVGSPLENPLALFRVAESRGRLSELELTAKLRSIDASLPPGTALFINVDPTALIEPAFISELTAAWKRIPRDRQLVVELTERHLNTSPRLLMRAVEQCRDAGWAIALDDIGARAESLTALALVRPDIVKLDMSLLKPSNRHHAAATTVALAGYRERRPVRVVAEGVETSADVEVAMSLGATHLQGYFFGRPAPIEQLEPATTAPFDWSALELGHGTVRRTGRRQLVALSHHIESLAAGPDTVVLASVQRADHYTPAMFRQYAALARRCGLVAVMGVGLAPGVRNGVHHGRLQPGDPHAARWSVLVLQSTGSVALFADQVDADDACGRTLFDHRITRNHDEIEAAARRLIQSL